MLQVEVDQEIVTSTNNDSISSSKMANTKQTNLKEASKQGSPARFPNKGKPGGKAAKHLQASSEDDNNNIVKGAVKAEQRRQVYGRKLESTRGPQVLNESTIQEWEPCRKSGITRRSMDLSVQR